MTTPESLLRMFIIDVLRHGGGAHFEGLLARLNNDGCIGWRDVAGREFTADEVKTQIRKMIHDGEVVLESMWDGRGKLTPADALMTQWNVGVLITNTEKAIAEWENWEAPTTD